MHSKDKVMLRAEPFLHDKALISVYRGGKKIGSAIADAAVWINDDTAALKTIIVTLLDAIKHKEPVAIVQLKGGHINV